LNRKKQAKNLGR